MNAKTNHPFTNPIFFGETVALQERRLDQRLCDQVNEQVARQHRGRKLHSIGRQIQINPRHANSHSR